MSSVLTEETFCEVAVEMPIVAQLSLSGLSILGFEYFYTILIIEGVTVPELFS